MTNTNRIEFQAQLNSAKLTTVVVPPQQQAVAMKTTTTITTTTTKAPRKQIHVFIKGLNTCPIYCHVCQQLIPLIAYASKCHLCSFTCHSACSEPLLNTTTSTTTSNPDNLNNYNSSSTIPKSKSFKKLKNQDTTTTTHHHQAAQNIHNPLKYCHINYLASSIDYNNYINKLININTEQQQQHQHPSNTKSTLVADYLYINVDNKWKRLWLSLKLDQPQLDLFQTKTNLKPFDTINLITDRLLIETNIKQIQRICGASETTAQAQPSTFNVMDTAVAAAQVDLDDNIYEELSNVDVATNLINFEQSSLVILLYNKKLCLKIGFTSFDKKNIWYDALQSSILIGNSQKKRITTAVQPNHQPPPPPPPSEEFKFFNINKVLKPFLELVDTVVNSYCYINENLIALACDDGLYAINSLVQNQSQHGDNDYGEQSTNQTSLVKIDTIESAHKLYYHEEFGKLCFIGRKSRQFLSIDLADLNKALINYDSSASESHLTDDRQQQQPQQDNDSQSYYYDDDDDDAKSVQVHMEHILDIDRCYLFECSTRNKSNSWYLAVATPDIIYILLWNKVSHKYTMIKIIQTAKDSPCICLKFTNNLLINQLIYGCGKEFNKMDMTYLQPSSVLSSSNSEPSKQHPIAVCVIDSAQTKTPNQAVLLCYEEYGLFLFYNFASSTWNNPAIGLGKKSSSSSIVPSTNSTEFLKWPRGNGLTPLQIEYDSNYLYLFYNDSICAYSIHFSEANMEFSIKKCGVMFICKPKFLSTLNMIAKNMNYLIISNRRPLDQITDQISKVDDVYTNDQQQQPQTTDAESESARSTSTKIKEELDHDFNDKICLSYFCPDSN
jgi:hypothetical protein